METLEQHDMGDMFVHLSGALEPKKKPEMECAASLYENQERLDLLHHCYYGPPLATERKAVHLPLGW